MTTLGIDPGRDSGAAVLLSSCGTEVLWFWTWKSLKRKGGDVWRVSTPDESWDVTSVWAIGAAIADQSNPDLRADEQPDLVVEGLFVPRRRRGLRPISPQSVIPLAEATGELVGGLRMTPRFRPLANTWRFDVLSLPNRTAAQDAERAAVAYAGRVFAWPEGSGIGSPPSAAERGALGEAACIAFWGRGRMRWG